MTLDHHPAGSSPLDTAQGTLHAYRHACKLTHIKVYYWGIRFPLRPSLAFTRKRPFPSQTRRLDIAFWRLPREPASTHTLSHIVRAARQCASHTRAQHVRGRSGRAADALHLLCLQCANWRFSQHCGCVVPGCSSDSRRRPRAL